MHIRKAETDDLSEIMDIYRTAQDFMIKTGNPTQWGHEYPTCDMIKKDIDNRVCYLICEDDTPHGVFALLRGDDPTYHYIENGRWINDDAYVTVHRIASDGKVNGIFKCAVEYSKEISDNIRIDTHESNIIMQHVIEKNGFVKCGRIYVRDGSPRLAYQWSRLK